MPVDIHEPWEDITDILTPEGIASLQQRLKAGTKPVLIFDFEGTPIHLRIRKISRGKVWAQKTHLYTDEEMKKEISVIKVDEADAALDTPGAQLARDEAVKIHQKAKKANDAIRTKKD